MHTWMIEAQEGVHSKAVDIEYNSKWDMTKSKG